MVERHTSHAAAASLVSAAGPAQAWAEASHTLEY